MAVLPRIPLHERLRATGRATWAVVMGLISHATMRISYANLLARS